MSNLARVQLLIQADLLATLKSEAASLGLSLCAYIRLILAKRPPIKAAANNQRAPD